MKYAEIESGLDPGIRWAVKVLMNAGIETFESCQGGPGHTFPEPTVRFHGYQHEAYKALAAASESGLNVAHLRRVWDVVDGELRGPHWELVLTSPVQSHQV